MIDSSKFQVSFTEFEASSIKINHFLVTSKGLQKCFEETVIIWSRFNGVLRNLKQFVRMWVILKEFRASLTLCEAVENDFLYANEFQATSKNFEKTHTLRLFWRILVVL